MASISSSMLESLTRKRAQNNIGVGHGIDSTQLDLASTRPSTVAVESFLQTHDPRTWERGGAISLPFPFIFPLPPLSVLPFSSIPLFCPEAAYTARRGSKGAL